MIPALLKWIGNKRKFAEEIVSLMPYRFNDYYEPLLGSGAVMAHALHRKNSNGFSFNGSYGGDTLPFLIELFNIVKNDPETVIDHYAEEITIYYEDKDHYNTIRDRFSKNPNPLDFCLLSRTCYSGVIRFRKSDGYMSTPRGPHVPISPESFAERVYLWSGLIQDTDFECRSFTDTMDLPMKNDVVYCDPPYTHSQTIIYGSQDFDIDVLWEKIGECKSRGAYVMLSLNGTRDSRKKDISHIIPDGLFERKLSINCGTSMIDRLQNSGNTMKDKDVHDMLLLTW